ncbi:hypothetical protein [Halobacteriovorax sp. RZ-3]|uniref:hypothetical protein n=1 Tax=unclassified Halobacteriovorax TaxID=2639665 RepID=UPI0037211F33
MELAPKLLEANKISNTKVELRYESGEKGVIDLALYFNDVDLTDLQLNSEFNIIEYSDTEIDSNILYSILTMKPITHKDKVVFDPSLGRKAWS